jgi:hypothetical protein
MYSLPGFPQYRRLPFIPQASREHVIFYPTHNHVPMPRAGEMLTSGVERGYK